PRRFTLTPGVSPKRSVLCGTFPRSPGAAVNGHPALRSPDFPPASRRAAARPPPARGARRVALLAGLLSLGLPVQHALAVRAEDELLVALDLVVELRRDVHVTALAGAAANRNDGNAAATREDHLVAAPQVGVDRDDQLVASRAIALDVVAEAADRVLE